MVEITDIETLRAWLKTQPDDISVTIAIRCALRVLPLINRSQTRLNMALPVFWATALAVSKIQAIQPSKRQSIRYTADAADAAYAAADSADADTYAAYAAYAAADAYAADADAAYTAYVATDAADAADAAYAAAADADTYAAYAAYAASLLYGAIKLDAKIIETNGNTLSVFSFPLWHEVDPPSNISSHWRALRKTLLEQDQNWSVWTDWYDTLLYGEFKWIEQIEVGDPDAGQYGRVTFPTEYYDDPTRLNAALKQIIDDYWAKQPKSVPPKRPASIRPVWREGRLRLNTDPLDPDIEEELAVANLQALRDELTELVEDVRAVGNFNPRPALQLERLAKIIPDTLPDSRTLFRMIRKEAILLECLTLVNNQWPDSFAATYRANYTELSRTLDMFRDRRVAKRQGLEAELESHDLNTVVQDVRTSMQAMRQDDGAEIIDTSFVEIVDEIADDYSQAATPESQLPIVADLAEGHSNTMKALAEKGLEPGNFSGLNQSLRDAYAANVEPGMVEGAATAGREDGAKIGAAIARANAAKEAGQVLSDKFSWLGWMKSLPYMGDKANKDPDS